MSGARLIGDCRIGEGTLLDETVILGHPSKKSQLEGRTLGDSLRVTVGRNCILRSNTVIYEDVVLGDRVQTAHNVMVREGVRVGDGCVFGSGVCVLDHAQMGRNVRIMEQALVCEGAVIGNDVFIAPQVSMTRGRHILGAFVAAGRMTPEKADEMEARYADPDGPSVIIEDDVRVGVNSVLLAGVTLHRGAVVAAGAVVSTDVPENHLAIGNPARVLPNAPPPLDT